jgi:hypothetical protein
MVFLGENEMFQKLIIINILLSLMVIEKAFSSELESSTKSLSPSEQGLLERGEVPTREYILGGATGTLLGFGTGHVVQNRFRDRGVWFAAGESVSALVWLSRGLFSCSENDLRDRDNSRCQTTIETSQNIFLAIKVMEILDLWLSPPTENIYYRELRSKWTNRVTVKPTLTVENRNNIGAGLKINF